MGGGKEAKRRRALLRSGLSADEAASKAAEEFANIRKKQAEIEKLAAEKAEKDRKAAREKRKRATKKKQAQQDDDNSTGKSRINSQPVSEKKKKKDAKKVDVLEKDSLTQNSERSLRKKTHIVFDANESVADQLETPSKSDQPLSKKKKRKDVANDGDDGQSGSSSKKIKRDPNMTVFVGQLPYTADADSLKEHFEKGGIRGSVSIRMLTDPSTGKSKGMAFVQLASDEDVLSALKLHQSEFLGRWINVERSGTSGLKADKSSHAVAGGDAGEKPPIDRKLSVFVAQLPFAANEDSIRSHFESAGVDGIVSIKMLSERGTNKKGMAFVKLSSEDSMIAALKLHESRFGGRTINVERSTARQAKQKVPQSDATMDVDEE